MDRKSIVILILCSVLLFLWPMLYNKISPPRPLPPQATNTVSAATNQLAEGTNQAPVAATQTTSVGGSNSVSTFVVRTNIPEQLLVVTNDNAVYTFTSRGGGIKQVELAHYPETVSSRRQKQRQTNELATLNTPLAPPVMAILGGTELQDDGSFTLTRTNGGVHAEKLLSNGLALVKDFQFGSNYLVTATVRMENRSKQPVSLPAQEWFIGTATPMGPRDNAQAEGVLWYNGSKSDSVNLPYFSTNTSSFFGLMSRTPLAEYRGGTNVAWAAVQNQFFTLAAMPKTPAPGLVVRMINLPAPTAEELRIFPKANRTPGGLETALTYPALVLQPGQTNEHQFSLYAGPKEYRTLAKIGQQFNNDLDLIMGFGWFAPVSKTLLAAMNWMHHALMLPYGWAIITITVLIKAIFWPLTKYSTQSAKKMQALQPQIKALQEKYKDEPAKISQKQMELYRKNKVNPLSGCLPMLVQIPVFFGFYRMLQSAIELRGAPFLWIGDLSNPDTVFVIPGFNFPLNPMPLIMGATMLWQAQITPVSPGMDPSQQKIMKFMPLMMLLFLYNFSSGLALYWTVNNLLTILQTRLTRTLPAPSAGTAKVSTPVAPQKKKSN